MKLYIKTESGFEPATEFQIIEGAYEFARESVIGRELVLSSNAAAEVCRGLLAGSRVEKFGVLFLDNSHRIIASEILASGTINSSHIHPREVFKRALELDAAALIICHNHPSGSLEPSEADIKLTRILVEASKALNITVLDHIIVSVTGGCTSFADDRIMPE